MTSILLGTSVTEPSEPKRPFLADALATPTAAGVFLAGAVLDVPGVRGLSLLGTSLLALAVPLIVLPFFHLSRYGKPDRGRPFYETTRPVTKGTYRLVRHPQYLGYALLVVGLAAVNPHPLTWILAAVAAALFYLQAVAEERYCVDTFGAEYREYVRAVPRFNLPLGLLRVLTQRDKHGN